jgi:hypothetical protein
VPTTQLPPWQQPPLQGSVGLHAAVHRPVVRLQAFPVGQSEAMLQPQSPPRQAEPLGLPEQLLHAPPELPQAAVEVPALQVAPPQQPPLQVCEPPHADTQLWVPGSQAWTPLQSPETLQPQVPPPATARHTPPAALDRQLVQVPPLAPQPACAVPATHRPLWQQPPWQAWVALQALVHWCVPRSQAFWLGQSAGPLQPQVVPIQRWPIALTVQSTQAAPAGPQAECAEPVAQVPPLQQPPEQGWVSLHEVTHWCIVRSQADPAEQSPVALQPQEPPLASAMQTAPIELEPQAAQAAPESPHFATAVPSTHVPPEQQPPLHNCVGEQLVTH